MSSQTGASPLGFSFGDIFGKGLFGEVANGLAGSLVDPANISGAFGKNQGPGAFLDPKGTGGSFLPGQSFGSKGVLGVNPHMGFVGPVGESLAGMFSGYGLFANMLRGLENMNVSPQQSPTQSSTASSPSY